ncbi:MAG: TIM barrel protein [Paenibacillaceae bacterium]|nr:TIM barrel protein [Paenibacillaceae bacterium]
MTAHAYTIGNSTFGLYDYPSADRPWSLERKFEATAAGGYRHFEGDFGGDTAKAPIRALAARFGLELGALRFGIRTEAQMAKLLQEAEELGAAYVVAIAGHAHHTTAQSVDLLGRFLDMAERAGFPLYIETHRDSATQDLLRCAEIVEQLPRMPLMLDLSHLLVAGEITADLYEERLPLFAPLFERALGFHGRISNGAQIQIGLDSAEDEEAQQFARFWEHALRAWKQAPAAAGPFRFTVELGPPPYALTRKDEHGRRVEIKDRIEQGTLHVALFEQVWHSVFDGASK